MSANSEVMRCPLARSTLARMFSATSGAINTVMSPAAYSAGFLNLELEQGLASYVDVIAYHDYETPPERTGITLSNVRLVMAANGASAIPLWDTEGASGTTKTSVKLAAEYLARKFLTDLMFGAWHFDWYTWGPATPFCVGTEMSNHSTSAAGKAYGYLQGWLSGATLNAATIDPANNWEVGLTLTNGDRGVVVWNPKKTFLFIPGLCMKPLMFRKQPRNSKLIFNVGLI